MSESLMHLPMYYGSRARIGVIVPPTNTANEAEWQRMAPEQVSIHSARMPLHTDTKTRAGIAALQQDIKKHAMDLAAAEVDVIAYGCTAGSMVSPVESLATIIAETTGRKALTTSQSIVHALNTLSVNKVSVATPYFDTMNQHEKVFLESNGFEVEAIEGLGYGANGIDDFRNICRITPETVTDLALKVDSDHSDAVLLTCTDLTTLPVISLLENRLGKPVISSNSATFWYSLRLAGITDNLNVAGKLFEHTI